MNGSEGDITRGKFNTTFDDDLSNAERQLKHNDSYSDGCLFFVLVVAVVVVTHLIVGFFPVDAQKSNFFLDPQPNAQYMERRLCVSL